jgi:tRNA pseudouridine38-40 synthase
MKSARSRTASPPSRATYRVVVEYDGTEFSGFQYQPHERTIAGTLEEVLSRLFDEPIKITAAGRTDAGVHAVGQVLSFVAHASFPIDKLTIALNSALPADLSARDAERVAPDFSARNSALDRAYTYVVFNRPEPSAVARRWSCFEYRPLDLELMRRAAADLIGEHDFLTFCGVFPERGGTIRTLQALEIERDGDFVRLHFRAGGFLHRMVRIITGSLLEIGSGRRAPDAIPGLLAARDRRAAGLTAPPQGLFFVEVRYPEFTSRPAGGLRWPLAAGAGA